MLVLLFYFFPWQKPYNPLLFHETRNHYMTALNFSSFKPSSPASAIILLLERSVCKSLPPGSNITAAIRTHKIQSNSLIFQLNWHEFNLMGGTPRKLSDNLQLQTAPKPRHSQVLPLQPFPGSSSAVPESFELQGWHTWQHQSHFDICVLFLTPSPEAPGLLRPSGLLIILWLCLAFPPRSSFIHCKCSVTTRTGSNSYNFDIVWRAPV